ncbi:eosinophil peroxidase-like [Xenia sp. Carnegie-2017]|uniref:eosinophil peroxidase-like n=1 Tax=Xenia sp. Carnegie-2017 TaxID=2897299 RepID=UPI001F0412C0|nr:eosinophil peroxidase-like [Xenia sp. Carnegie-2017]
MTTKLILLLVLYITTCQATDFFLKSIISEKTPLLTGVFKSKFRATTGAAFQLLVTDGRFQAVLVLGDNINGIIVLNKTLFGLIPFGSERTFRITCELRHIRNNILLDKINLVVYVLKAGYADSLLKKALSVMDKVKLSNPFRPTGQNFRLPKKLHSILMATRSRRTRANSLASCKFNQVCKEAEKLIKTEVDETAEIYVGPEGMFSEERLEELIEETGCIPEISNIQCEANQAYRSIDGTCNNLDNPTQGAADTIFSRMFRARYFDAEGLNEPAGGGLNQPNAPNLPNPSKVTDEYIVIQDKNQPNRDGITHLFMQWGQFIDHDLTLAPESENGDICENIPCDGSAEDFVDPCFPILPFGQRPCIRLIRSAARCDFKKATPREQINVNTAYLDASMVYGSSESVQDAVRDAGNLRFLATSGDNLPPIDNSQLGEPLSLCENLGSCFLAGDNRINEQAALAAMHTLWVREHNRIARRLSRINPHWYSEKIYQEARKIVGALIQHITYEEWLPILIGTDVLDSNIRYNPRVNASISNEFATIAFRLGHSLIRPKFEFLKRDYESFPFSPVPLRELFFNNTLAQVNGIDGWMIGMVGNVSQEMDNEMAIGLTNELFQRDEISREGLNLAALNMQRAREHGLRFICTFEPEVLQSLKSVYNNRPQNTDVFAAGIGEKPRISSANESPILGPTFTCIVKDQFDRLRQGDRFFYTNPLPEGFTDAQRKAIEARKLSDVICDNIDVISVQQKAFFAKGRKEVCDRTRRLNIRPWRESSCCCH